MSAKIPLSGLSHGELEALAERLLAENDVLKQALVELRAEVATLKGVKGRPKVRLSGMEKGTTNLLTSARTPGWSLPRAKASTWPPMMSGISIGD
jgi:hypothetical protein